MEKRMKKLTSSSVFGLVAVPPAPYTSLRGRRGEAELPDTAHVQKLLWHPDGKRRSWRASLTVAISAIALIGVAMVVVSVRATSAPPTAGSHTKH
jgi:hypothetical protein